jgi:hypothetical protein
MNVNRLLVLMMSVLLLPAFTWAKDKNPFDRELDFKSGVITYAISGMENGSEVMYIRDYGKRNAIYHTTVTNMMGMKIENNSIEIEDPEWVYSYDLVEQTGVKGPNPKKYLIEEYEKLSGTEQEQVQKNAEKFGMGVMTGMGGTVEKNAAELLGYMCDRVSAMGTTVYSIHESQIPLKTESNIMGMQMSIVATSFDKGKVEDKYFTHPAGIEAVFDQEADTMARQMAIQTMDWLKDSEAGSVPPQLDGAGQLNRMQQVPQEDQEMMKQAEQMMEGLKGMLGN